MPASLNLPRRLDPEEVFVIPGMQSITMSTLVGSSETVYVAAQPRGLPANGFCVGNTGLYSKSIARSRSLPNRLFPI